MIKVEAYIFWNQIQTEFSFTDDQFFHKIPAFYAKFRDFRDSRDFWVNNENHRNYEIYC